MSVKKKGVLFVCHGNICRSPAAEGVFRVLLRDRGLESQLLVDSAGTSDEHEGDLPHSVTRRVAARHGIDLTHRSRPFRAADFDTFDLILLMDNWNFRNVSALARGDDDLSRLRLYRSFDPVVKTMNRIPEVPDPYYGGLEGFEQVHEIFQRTSPAILEFILNAG